MLHPPGFYFVKKPKRFVIFSSDKSSERNLSCFFDIIKPRRMEHLRKEEPFSSDPYFRVHNRIQNKQKFIFRLFFTPLKPAQCAVVSTAACYSKLSCCEGAPSKLQLRCREVRSLFGVGYTEL